MGLGTLMPGVGAHQLPAAQRLGGQLPSLLDPGIFQAGTTAARRARQSSGRPRGLEFADSMGNWLMELPALKPAAGR